MKKLLIVMFLVVAVLSFSVTVEFWHAMSGPRIPMIQDIAQRFMDANPGIRVNVQYTGSYTETLNQLQSAVRTGNAPHIVQVYEIGTRAMIDGGVAIKMQDLINNDPDFDDGVFLDEVLNYYRVEGELYSMPFNPSNAILFFNRTLFEEAGLDPNKPPKTYSEFLDYARQLTKRDARGNITQYGLTWPMHSWLIEQLLAVQDAPLVDNDNGRTARAEAAVFNSEAGEHIFKLFDDLNKERLIYNPRKQDWAGARQAFMSGQAAMVLYSTSDVKVFSDTLRDNGYELGTGFLPRPDGAPAGGVIIGGGSVWLVDGHPDAETQAAWDFIKFMNSREEQISWHILNGYLPTRKDAIVDLLDQGFYSENPNYLTAIFQLVMSVQTPNTNGAVMGVFPEARDRIETAIERMFSGEITYKRALEIAENEVTRLIKEYNEFFQ